MIVYMYISVLDMWSIRNTLLPKGNVSLLEVPFAFNSYGLGGGWVCNTSLGWF